MTSYFDTSALLKLYIDEPDSEALRRSVGDASLATCRVTWAEAHAALARRERESPELGAVWSSARERFVDDWPGLHVIDVTQALVEKAGEFASVFALRGYDAVQLATGYAFGAVLDEPPLFVSFDRRLNRAARLLGMALPENAPL